MIKSVLTVLRGTVLAQAIGVLILPLLTRSFDAEAFGHLQFYQALALAISVFATFRYELAILRAKPGRELGAVLFICATCSFGLAIIAGLASMAANFFLPQLVGSLGLASWIFPVAVLAVGFPQFVGYLLVREEAYSTIANAKVSQGATYAGSAVSLALIAPFYSGLIVADLIGRAGSMLWSVIWLRKRLPELAARPSHSDIKAAIIRFKEFPFYAVPGGLTNALGGALTPLLIYGVFSPADAGQFGLVERGVGIPVAMIVGATAQVYSAQLAARHRSGAHVVSHFRKLVVSLALLAVLPALLATAFAPWLFALVFGSGWNQAAEFARYLIPAYAVVFVAGSVNMALIVIGEQRWQLVWEIMRLLAMVLLWTGGSHVGFSLQALVAGHATITLCSSLAFLLIVDSRLRLYERSIERPSV